MNELQQSPKKQGSLPSYFLGVGFLLLLIGYIFGVASNQSSVFTAALGYLLLGTLAFLVGIVLFLVGLVIALNNIKRAIELHHACLIIGVGLLLFFLGIIFVNEDITNKNWLNFFYGGICSFPIGIVLFLVGLVRALRDMKAMISPGTTTKADFPDGEPHGLSSLADYTQTPGYAPSTLSSSLPIAEEVPLTQHPVLDQKISRRKLMITLSGLAAEATIGIIVFKLTRKPGKQITPDLFTYQGHTDDVTSVAWSPDGKHIVSTSGDGTAQVWDPLTGKLFVTFQGHHENVDDAAWSPDSRFIASCGASTVQIWDAITGKVLWTYSHDQPFNGVAWSPDGTRIASVSDSVHVFDAASGRDIYSLEGSSVQLGLVVAWSPDSRYLATSPPSGSDVHVHNASTGETIFVYTGHSADVTSVAWSPDGQLLASGSLDNTVRVWRLAGVNVSDPTVYTYHGHSDSVNQVAWSPDSKRIASASGYGVVGTTDNTVQVWDATTGNRAYIYNGHSGPVTGVSWSPNGKYIASSSVDKTVQVWQAP